MKFYPIAQIVFPGPPTLLQDSGPLACGLGVYTTLLDPVVADGRWFELRIQAGAGGTLSLATGAAGFEVNVIHQNFGAGTNDDILNIPFQWPAGSRLSIIPTVNLAAAEAHIFY